eukprot:SAG31_NODE_102_length_25175_cov_10.778553_7_plen_71_part_00
MIIYIKFSITGKLERDTYKNLVPVVHFKNAFSNYLEVAVKPWRLGLEKAYRTKFIWDSGIHSWYSILNLI